MVLMDLMSGKEARVIIRELGACADPLIHSECSRCAPLRARLVAGGRLPNGFLPQETINARKDAQGSAEDTEA